MSLKFWTYRLRGGQNPRWPPSTRYGTANFFPMGHKVKILFSTIGFWGTRNALKPFLKLCKRYFSLIRRILRFSAVLKHFASIFHYFYSRNMFFVDIPMFLETRNQNDGHLENYETSRVARFLVFLLNSAIFRVFLRFLKHFPSNLRSFLILQHDSCCYTPFLGRQDSNGNI